MAENRGVVVGVDGSDSSIRAVEWAADLAARRGEPLAVVHAWLWPLMRVPLGPAAGAPSDGGLENQAKRVVRQGMRIASSRHPSLVVSGQVITGGTALVLKRESEVASAVVIGSRELGRVAGFLVGSVALGLVGNIDCMLVVVRGREFLDGPVLVGIDEVGSGGATDAAFQEAADLDVEIRAVHAWTVPEGAPPGDQLELLQAAQARAGHVLDDALAAPSALHSTIPVERITPMDSPRHALVKLSAEAQLVVVGTRGRGGFRGLILGSTSHGLIHKADCPVMILPSNDLPDDAQPSIGIDVVL